jgi:hypothetical protein
MAPKAHGKQDFLGRFSAGASETCLAALAGLLNHIEANAEHDLGGLGGSRGPSGTATSPRSGRDGPRDGAEVTVNKRQLKVHATHF